MNPEDIQDDWEKFSLSHELDEFDPHLEEITALIDKEKYSKINDPFSNSALTLSTPTRSISTRTSSQIASSPNFFTPFPPSPQSPENYGSPENHSPSQNIVETRSNRSKKKSTLSSSQSVSVQNPPPVPSNSTKPTRSRTRNSSNDFIVDQEADYDIDYNEERVLPPRKKKKVDQKPQIPPKKTETQQNQYKLPQTPALLHCMKILEELISHEYSYPFLQPVDPVVLQLPNYFDVITQPMDLSTVKNRMLSGYYCSARQFHDEINLIWDNALTYNDPESEVYAMAKNLKEYFERCFIHPQELESPKLLMEDHRCLDIVHELKNAMKEIENQLKSLRTDGIPWSTDNDYNKFFKTSVRNIHPRNEIRVHKFSESDKFELQRKIQLLAAEHQKGVIQIIEEEMPHILTMDGIEMEVDLENLDNMTLSRLDSYTDNCLKECPPPPPPIKQETPSSMEIIPTTEVN